MYDVKGRVSHLIEMSCHSEESADAMRFSQAAQNVAQAALSIDGLKGSVPSEDELDQMVNRFLSWRLPDPWCPDGGIHFDADGAKKFDRRNMRYEPTGTNLFDATQARKMILHLLGAPVALDPPRNS